jgi:hypothetical protein
VELKQEVADLAGVLPWKMGVAGCTEAKALGRKLPQALSDLGEQTSSTVTIQQKLKWSDDSFVSCCRKA